MALDAELWRIPLFAALEPVALQELVLGARSRALRQGDLLFSRGEAAESGFVLTQGAIVLETRAQGGGPEKIVTPVALLGEIALIAPTARPAFATAREDSTLLEIPRALFRETLENHPTTAGRVRALLKERLAQLGKNLSSPEG
jgi:CRP-like cAMP-binding protein